MGEHVCDKASTINDMKDRLVKLEDNDRKDYGLYNKLITSMDMFKESNEEQSKSLIDIGKTLVKVNNNLDSLNTEIKQTNTRIDKLETKFYKIDDEGKINLRLWFKNILLKGILPVGGIGAIVYEVIQWVKK